MLPQPPVVVGLTVCRNVVVEPQTLDHSIERAFTGLLLEEFPSTATPFSVFVVLTDAQGDTTLNLVVARQDDPYVEARRIALPLRFRDRLQTVKCAIRVSRCSFPSPGTYLFTLYADDDWLAQTVVRVGRRETEP